MKKIASFLVQNVPFLLITIVLSLVASAANAYYVYCGQELSSGNSGYPSSYSAYQPWCDTIPATVYAYKNCIDQNGNACQITWNENYDVSYSFDSSSWTCNVIGGTWTSNSNIVDGCQ